MVKEKRALKNITNVRAEKYIEVLEVFHQLLPMKAMIRLLYGFIISSVAVGGHCFIGGAAYVAACGGGIHGFYGLLGVCVGYLSSFSADSSFLYIAVSLFTYTIAYLFQFISIYKHRAFEPIVLSCLWILIRAFGAVSVVRGEDEVYLRILQETLLGGSLAFLYSFLLREDLPCGNTYLKQYSLAALSVVLFMKTADIYLLGALSVGGILACFQFLILVTVYENRMTYPIAMIYTMALFAVSAENQTVSIHYFLLSILDALINKKTPVIRALLLLLSATISCVFQGMAAVSVLSLAENIIGILLFIIVYKLLVPLYGSFAREANTNTVRSKTITERVIELSSFMEEVAQYMVDAESPDEILDETEEILDRAFERVCGNCEKKSVCWSDRSIDMLSVLEEPLNGIRRRGKLIPSDFPEFFHLHCENSQTMAVAINYELSRYTDSTCIHRLEQEHIHQMSTQYNQFARLLEGVGSDLEGNPQSNIQKNNPADLMKAELGFASKRKQDERVCGDSAAYFKTEDEILYIILSDGIGSGRMAQNQSGAAVSFLKKAITVLQDNELAIELMNSILYSKNSGQWAYSTIDLVSVDLYSRVASFYKLGAADSIILQGNAALTVKGNAYSAGIEPKVEMSMVKQIYEMQEGDILIMASDGICIPESNVLADLANSENRNMKRFAKSLLLLDKDSSDDKTVITLKLTKREECV